MAQLSPAAPREHKLTVATNPIAIAAEVLKRPELQLIMLGGLVDPHLGGCVDANAVARLAEMNIDRCFSGACAVAAAGAASPPSATSTSSC